MERRKADWLGTSELEDRPQVSFLGFLFIYYLSELGTREVYDSKLATGTDRKSKSINRHEKPALKDQKRQSLAET